LVESVFRGTPWKAVPIHRSQEEVFKIKETMAVEGLGIIRYILHLLTYFYKCRWLSGLRFGHAVPHCVHRTRGGQWLQVDQGTPIHPLMTGIHGQGVRTRGLLSLAQVLEADYREEPKRFRFSCGVLQMHCAKIYRP